MLKDRDSWLVGMDVLRGIFCLVIVVYHTDGMFGCVFSRWFPALVRYGGYLGNYVFFMVSGLCTAYRHGDETALGSFVGYMKGRIGKIYPMYILSNLAMLLVGGTEITFTRIISTVLLVSNGWHDGEGMPLNYPCMFVCIWVICQMWYYAVRKLAARYPGAYVPVCGFFVVWGMFLEKMDWNVPLNYVMCGEGYMNFFLGVLLAELFGKTEGDWLAGCGCEVLGVILAVSVAFGFDGLPWDFRWTVSLVCVCLVCIMLDSRISALRGWRPLWKLGRCSMAIFLWHVPLARGLFLLEGTMESVRVPAGPNFVLYIGLLLMFSVAVSRIKCLKEP